MPLRHCAPKNVFILVVGDATWLKVDMVTASLGKVLTLFFSFWKGTSFFGACVIVEVFVGGQAPSREAFCLSVKKGYQRS